MEQIVSFFGITISRFWLAVFGVGTATCFFGYMLGKIDDRLSKLTMSWSGQCIAKEIQPFYQKSDFRPTSILLYFQMCCLLWFVYELENGTSSLINASGLGLIVLMAIVIRQYIDDCKRIEAKHIEAITLTNGPHFYGVVTGHTPINDAVSVLTVCGPSNEEKIFHYEHGGVSMFLLGTKVVVFHTTGVRQVEISLGTHTRMIAAIQAKKVVFAKEKSAENVPASSGNTMRGILE